MTTQQLPYHLFVRTFTKPQLWAVADRCIREMENADRLGDVPAYQRHETRFNLIHNELDRRDREQRQRQERKIARLHALANAEAAKRQAA